MNCDLWATCYYFFKYFLPHKSTVFSQGDAKGLEEEEETAARPVPIWKATHITEILEDPVETEEEPTPLSPVVSRKGSKDIHTSLTLV